MKRFICLATLALSLTAHGGETVFGIESQWRYWLGTQEASSPDTTAWRGHGFDDSQWGEGLAPIGYSVVAPAEGLEGQIRTFLPTGGQSNYTTVYLRKSFNVTNASAIVFTLHVDDGAVAWLNGVEIARANAPSGELAYNAQALVAEEVRVQTVTIFAGGALIQGENVIAVHALNSDRFSSDFVFAASLEVIPDEPPSVIGAVPSFDTEVNSLQLLEVVFDEAVTGVDAADLLLNGEPATNVVSYAPNDYVFYSAQPALGLVNVSFAQDHGIMDTDVSPTPFPGANWTYTLVSDQAMNVTISEFLADNSANIEDEDGDNSDWIEIYNIGPSIANLAGWHLTDDPADLRKWTFPSHLNMNLGPNSYLLVWASGKNRTNSIARLHTNFRLERSGEYLALVAPSLDVISEFAPRFPPQVRDNSYGRDRVDPELVGYYTVPTPGQQNTTSGPGFSEPPTFSMSGGLFTVDSITLMLSARSNAVIRYTLDGSEPLTTSPLYEADFVFSTNIVVKARAFEPGLWPSPVVAHTYLFVDSSLQNFSSRLPIIVVSTSGRPIPGNIVPGGNRPRGSLTVIDTFRGRSTLQTAPQFHGLAQFERYGQTSAGMPKTPIRVELNDEIGNDIDVSLLGLPPEADFQLEAKMSDKSFLNGHLAHELHRQMGHYAPRRRFVELFVDTPGGRIIYPQDYVGVYELVEKIERDPERVDIAELTPNHTTEPEISGGYIFKKDKDSLGDLNFAIPGMNGFAAQRLKIHEPKPRFITAEQFTYISNYVHQFAASLYHPDWLQLTGTNHYSHYIDVDSFVDQHWIVEYTKNIDGYRLSRFWSKDRGGKIVDSPIWDFDLCFGNADYLECALTNGWYWNIQQEGIMSGEHAWHRRLIYGLPNIVGIGGAKAAPEAVMNSGDPEFIQKVIDRWGTLRTNVLDNERVLARVDELAALLAEAADRNFSKYPNFLNNYFWPNPTGPPTWHVNYATQTNYVAVINEMKKWINGRFHWLDGQFVRAPRFTHPGGFITGPVELTISAPAGIVYYTTDGTDPRAAGGAVAPDALVYSEAVQIEQNALVFARARVGTSQYSWSPPAIVNFYSHIPSLRIVEIMYHPPQEGHEYIVVENIGEHPLNLNRFSIGGGVQFTFPSITLQGGERAFVVENEAAFIAHYGTGHTIAGQYSGRLDNGGEGLTLTGPRREPILDFAYDDSWYPITDGLGFSLLVVDVEAPTSRWSDPTNWRPNGAQGIPRVVINELLSNPQNGATDTVELHNLSAENADVSGWYVTDDLDRRDYRIPEGTVIAAGDYVVLAGFPFGFAQEGEEAFLLSAHPDGSLSGYLTGFQFGGQRTGVTFGRHVNSVGQEHFVSERARTLGAPNAGPAVPEVVISEILYRPQVVATNGALWDNTEDEFVELYNRGDAQVNLSRYMLGGAGIQYQFGSVAIQPGTHLIVVSFDPVSNPAQLAVFREKFYVPASTSILGPYSGSLSSSGGLELLELLDYGTGDFETLLERIDYGESPPWPSGADGTGLSLHRLAPAEYANDPVNWNVEAPSPGRSFAPGVGPAISQHPRSQTVVAGTAEARFSVTVSTPNVRYQWRKDSQTIDGGTGATLTLRHVELSAAGNYNVVVWNNSGHTISSNAVLTVVEGIRIHEQPRSVSIRIPGTARFFVLASSPNPIAYQWRFNGVPIPGANGPELLLSDPADEAEGLYDVLMTDAVGTVLSAAARLTVLAAPAMVAPVPPLNLSAAAGDTFTASARFRGTLPIYARWRWTPAEGITFTLGDQIINERIASFSFTVPQGTLGHLRVSLTNAIGGTLGRAVTNASITVLADADGDRIPDEYERANGLREDDPADAAADADNDTVSNRDEYIAGTDPQDASSYLKVDRLEAANTATIHFRAISNRTYSVQYTDSLNPPIWRKLEDVLAQPTNHSATVTDPASVATRFYRLATPPPISD